MSPCTQGTQCKMNMVLFQEIRLMRKHITINQHINLADIMIQLNFFYSVRLVIITNHRKDSLNWHENSYYLLVVCNVRYVLLLCSLSRNLLKDLFQEYYECPVQDSRFFIYIVHARDLFLFFYLFQRVRYITNVNDVTR